MKEINGVETEQERVASSPQPLTSTATGRTTKSAIHRFTGYFPHALAPGGVVKTCDFRRLYEKP